MSASRWKRILLRLGLAAAFFFCFLQSVTVTAQWWKGSRPMEFWDWLWVAALAPLIVLYLRYFSILGQARPECLLPPEETSGRNRP